VRTVTVDQNERIHQWSKMLKDALDSLIDDDTIIDKISADQEAHEAEGSDKAA
jgi:hypothetical protein